MRAQRRADALSRVRECLAVAGLIEGKFTIRIECDDGSAVEIRCEGLPDEDDKDKDDKDWPQFSPLERRIVACLRGRGGWMVTAALAEAVGEEPGTEFRCVLRNLGERGVVETNQKHGVRLVVVADCGRLP